MALPPLPRESGNAQQDIHALYLYLQRSRDDFQDSVNTVEIVSNYTDENAQDAIGNILTDSSTVDFTYNDATPTISGSVIPNSSVQRVEVARSDLLISTRKQLNLVSQGNSQFGVVDNTAQDRTDITVALGEPRLINESSVLQHTYSMIVHAYLEVASTLTLQGNACLRVL